MAEDRDIRKKRPQPSGVGLTEPPRNEVFDQDITGQYEGDDLERIRSLRPMDQRIARLEQKHDNLVGVVTETRVLVGEMSGQLSVLPELIQVVKDSSARAAQREHVTFTAQVDVDKAMKMDSIEGKKSRRERVTMIVGGVVTLMTSGAVIHYFLGKI